VAINREQFIAALIFLKYKIKSKAKDGEISLACGIQDPYARTNVYACQIQVSRPKQNKNPIIIISGTKVKFAAYISYATALQEITELKFIC